MGREIRNVPRNWEHPKEKGRYIPMFDQTYEDAAEEWVQAFIRWENGDDPDRKEYGYRYYWEWHDNPPCPDYYRPEFESEPDCYQIYETVSEGTPVSPVFEDLDSIGIWLIGEGYSAAAAEGFVKDKWAPSFVLVTLPDGSHDFVSDIESLALK